MPAADLIDTIQKTCQGAKPKMKTFFQTFVVEDDEAKDEFVIIAARGSGPGPFRS